MERRQRCRNESFYYRLLLQMGPCSSHSIEHYWSTNKLYYVMFWRSRISRNKFQLLQHYFHFQLVDNSIKKIDRLYKVRPVVNHFDNIMRQNYVLSMMLWYGRFQFHLYIHQK